MPRRRAIRLLVLLALLALPAGAHGASIGVGSSGILSGLFGGPGGGGSVVETDVSFRASGALTVSFHGDPASGCAAAGVCAYSGSVSWSPRPGGDITLLRERIHHRVVDQVYGFSLSLSYPEPQTSAQVTRTLPSGGASRCADAVVDTGSLVDTTARGGSFTIGLLQPGSSILSTRCAGPTDAELASVSPRATVSVSALRRGHTVIDLTRVHSFAQDGFAGTVSSTIQLQLGKPQTARLPTSLSALPKGVKLPPGLKLIPTRIVSETLRLAQLSGSEQAIVTGTANPGVCSLLDACGLGGTMTLRPVARAAFGLLTVTGPAKDPYQQFLATLGLRPGPRVPNGGGGVSWNDPAQAAVALTQGGNRCLSMAPLQSGTVALVPTARRLLAIYAIEGPLRSGCPGPYLSGQPLAVGSVPLSELGRRTFKLRLRAAGAINDDGYRVQLHGGLTLKLRRGRIAQQVQLLPSSLSG